MPSIWNLWKTVAMLISSYGTMRVGILFKIMALSIHFTGILKMAHGNTITTTAWNPSIRMYPFRIFPYTKRMLSPHGKACDCPPRLNGRWRPDNCTGANFGNGQVRPICLALVLPRPKGPLASTMGSSCSIKWYFVAHRWPHQKGISGIPTAIFSMPPADGSFQELDS